MNILVLTSCAPPDSGKEDSGLHRRLSVFIRALLERADSIHVLHYLPREWFERYCDPNGTSITGRPNWANGAQITFIPMQRSRPRWLEAIASIFSPKTFAALSGLEQMS